MAQQLNFDLPVTPDYTRDGFVVAPSNAVAMAMLDQVTAWPLGKLVISGPAGSGKTHLAHIWAADTGARMITSAEVVDADLTKLAQGPVIVEDMPLVRSAPAAQDGLFHLHNLLQEAGHPLLMTGMGTPNHWGMSLPDLQSRIDAAGHAALDLPDDALLTAVLNKHFTDRQLTPRPDVVPYLVAHMERSFAAAHHIVAALDAQSLTEGKAVTRPMARALLDISGS